MRIDLNHGPQPTGESSRGTQSAATGNATAGSALGVGLGEDQAQLSGAHVQVAALAAQAAQLPEVREEKVQALRQTVQSGQYHPSPEQLAGAVFEQLIVQPAA